MSELSVAIKNLNALQKEYARQVKILDNMRSKVAFAETIVGRALDDDLDPEVALKEAYDAGIIASFNVYKQCGANCRCVDEGLEFPCVCVRMV